MHRVFRRVFRSSSTTDEARLGAAAVSASGMTINKTPRLEAAFSAAVSAAENAARFLTIFLKYKHKRSRLSAAENAAEFRCGKRVTRKV